MIGELFLNLSTAWGGATPSCCTYYPEGYSDRLRFYEKNYTKEKMKVNSVGINIEGYHKEVSTIKDLLLTFQLLPTGDNTKCSMTLLYDAGFEGAPNYVEVGFKGPRS